MTKYKHLFFDLDQTLWDFETNSVEVLNELFIKYKLDDAGIKSCDEFIIKYKEFNSLMWLQYGKGQITKEKLRYGRFRAALKSYKIKNNSLADLLADEYLKISPHKTNLLPYTDDILTELKEHYHMHIITNGFWEVQQIKLDKSGLNKYFKNIFVSDLLGHKKPDIKIFNHALEIATAGSHEALMIGDNYECDIIGARSAGIDQVFFNPNGATPGPATYEIKCLSELRNLLLRN
ncbi:MAG: YjjG family noncanonical pyrimidine nucleotidase [Bacteroidia bacterium]